MLWCAGRRSCASSGPVHDADAGTVTERFEADAAAASGPAGRVELEPHDLELLRLLGDGLSVDQVARRANASERTVRRRYRTICDRLGVQTPIQAVVWAARRGLL